MLTRILTEDSEVDDLVPDWSCLAESQAHVTVFQHPGWATAWWRSFGDGRRLHIVVCHDGPDLVGVVPLMLEPAVRHLCFLGHPLNDRNGAVAAIADLDRVWGSAAAAAERHGLGIVVPDLTDVDVGPCTAALGADAVVTPMQPSPAIELPTSWSVYLAALSPGRVAGWRRDRTRLAAGASVRVEHLTGEALGRREIQEFHRQRLRRWRASGRIAELSAAERSGALVDFLDGLGEGLRDTVGMRLSRLIRDDVVVAQVFSLTWADVILDYMRAFEPAFARFGPGTLATLASVRNAIEEGRRLYDFGRGDESYKFVLGAAVRGFVGVEMDVPPADTVR